MADPHYHVYLGYRVGRPVGTAPKFWGEYAIYHARSTAKYLGQRGMRSSRADDMMVRQCRADHCDVLEGTPDKG